MMLSDTQVAAILRTLLIISVGLAMLAVDQRLALFDWQFASNEQLRSAFKHHGSAIIDNPKAYFHVATSMTAGIAIATAVCWRYLRHVAYRHRWIVASICALPFLLYLFHVVLNMTAFPNGA